MSERKQRDDDDEFIKTKSRSQQNEQENEKFLFLFVVEKKMSRKKCISRRFNSVRCHQCFIMFIHGGTEDRKKKQNLQSLLSSLPSLPPSEQHKWRHNKRTKRRKMKSHNTCYLAHWHFLSVIQRFNVRLRMQHDFSFGFFSLFFLSISRLATSSDARAKNTRKTTRTHHKKRNRKLNTKK